MIGLDTNILLGWVLARPSRTLPGEGPFRASHITIAELVWVLDRTFKRTRSEIASVIRLLLETEDLVVPAPDVVTAALVDFETGPADFADYLITHDNAAAGCITTLTLDKKAARHDGFTLRS